ncbi:unnamed protein product [Microthlaspi erraticum]|uniref:Uncharacterized protein n=1 Tax=Microthlaspi erraticum TaxID=1685480 RepID=A0A6D2IQ84_9BRAS|nr:unnamed protein product [Microthlaspi erraticum]
MAPEIIFKGLDCEIKNTITSQRYKPRYSGLMSIWLRYWWWNTGTFWTVCRTCKTQSSSFRFDSIRQATDGRKKIRDGNGVYGGEYDSFEWSNVYTGTKNPTHAPQSGPRKDEVVRREYTKRAPGVSLANAPKRRKGMENGVAGSVAGSNVAGGFSAKSNTVKEFSEEDLKNVLQKKVKPLVRRKLQELCMAVPETAIDAHGRRMETEI